ncbi:hypothetical protein ThidrDRAFT_1951 [Thiorhodococcus drewsii AZ1]|uniref:Tetratricopeptide repeat protein n=1 Tax=Thiorhodococcus drewsii AZ1 TaxID=765913 RepID=G2E0Y8_9GAMM|nr:hypothetical protein [Thiorhodococcus drewsii]EGV31329.1 hypothetical protein ThidrDRAFT_1951 [Thiorhodococcus drewsii AZ1]
MKRSSLIVVVLFPLILVLGFAILSPGLSGPFLLDDFIHLPKLAGDNGQIDTLSDVYQLIFSGERAIGRQLSYLSLLINDNAWPTTAYGFKRLNVLLHLLNGVLVFLFARMLANLICNRDTDPNHADWIALLVMSLWLVHPLHLSPTMMVIQRMTLLAGTFSLLALVSYLHGRRLAVDRPIAGYRWMILGFGSFLVLGIFSKETAIMTVCYVMVIEATLLARDRPPRPDYWRFWAWLFLGVPLLAIVAYFFSILPYIDQLYLKRDFNMIERLLTESRVLMQYLRVILLPSISASGPYHDDFMISRGLLEPATTLLSIITIFSLIGFAIWRRRRNPLLAFAILWFFLAHLLESTILPIELYFEHRNYLPMFGFAFAVSYWVMNQSGKLAVISRVGVAAFLSLTLLITFLSARVWGDANQISTVWAAEHPGSARAQIGAIRFWSKIGDSERLIEQFDLAQRLNPNDAGLSLLRLIIQRCRNPAAPPIGGDMGSLEQMVPSAHFEHGSLEGIDWIAKNAKKEGCDFKEDDLEKIIDLYLSNPRFYGNEAARTLLYRILADRQRKRGDLNATIQSLDLAYAARPSFDVALNQAWLLATAGLFEDADTYLQKARETPPRSKGERLWRDDKIAEIERLIRLMKKDMKTQSISAP